MPTTSCQSCGATIKFPSAKIGPPITCPACQAETPTVKPLTLPNPTNKSLPEHRPLPPTNTPIDRQMLDKLTSIEKMIRLFYSILLFQIAVAMIVAILACAGAILKYGG